MSSPPVKRHRWGRTLDSTLPAPTPETRARVITRADAALLADLMFSSYRGTPDDEGGDRAAALAEVHSTLSGTYGPFDFVASEIIIINDIAASATLVTHYQSDILIAFSMTAPIHTRQGLARAGLVRTLHRLREAGHTNAFLAVTDANTAARHLYQSLGFVPRPLPASQNPA
ncbi:MAG: GNAT family N-acetyltransferase [Planctomycetes bacterium]|nr:GNAT family N-acetyltransferase [Planctomycetota bacterium]